MVFPTSESGEGEGLEFDIIVNAQGAIDDLEKWREQIEKIKQDMRELQDQSKESLAQVRRALVSQQEGSLEGDAFDEFKTNAMVAQRELVEEQKRADQEMVRNKESTIRQNILLQKEESSQIIEEKQREIKQRVLLEKEASSQQSALNKQFVKEKEAEIQQQILLQKYLADEERKTSAENVQYKQREIQQQALLRQELDKTAKSATNLGNIFKFVFGAILGLSAITILRRVIGFLTAAAQEGYEFGKAIFQLEIGVRALQRAGMDITIRQVYDNIRLLRNEFGIFTEKELIQGTAALANLTRDLGFTSEEFFKMQKAVATLAVVNGRSMDEVQRTVALALSSGYTEGLQRLGVSINRVTIAQEASNMGFRGGYNALTEQQRALATYNLILRKTALYQDDLLEYQETAPGQIDRAKTAWSDLRREMGERLLPLWGLLGKIFADAYKSIEGINGIIEVLTGRMGNLGIAIRAILNPGNTLAALFKSLFTLVQDFVGLMANLNMAGFEEFGRNFIDNFETLKKELAGGDILGDTAQTAEMEAEKLMQDIETAISNGGDDIADVIKDDADKRKELAEDLQRDLEKIEREGARRREEIEREYARRLEDINRNAARDVAEANRKYAFDLAKLKEDEQNKVQDVIDKYRKKELEDEEDFQAKMKKLRQSFIFDLEEAVRSRDAVAIRRLQRRFNLDRQQLVDAYELEKRQRERNFREELEDAKRQNSEKRRELWIAFQQKLADIELQRQYELQDAAIKHQQDLEDLQRKLQEQREERLRAYRQDLEDLNTAMTERLKTIAKALAQEVEYTAQAAQAVYETLKAYYGPGGYIEQLYKYYLEYASQMPQLPSGGKGTQGTTPNFAYGGSMIVTTPTTFRAGEGGLPERVDVTPLFNRNSSLGDVKGSMGSSMSGMMKVLISLSPGLEGKIIESTLGQFDNILAGIERSR